MDLKLFINPTYGFPQARLDRKPLFGHTPSSSEAPLPTPVMGDFINLKDYTVYERQHAGWMMANALKSYILTNPHTFPDLGATTGCSNILEIGCSSGTSTLPIVQRLAQEEHRSNTSMFDSYEALDIDPAAIKLLQQQLEQLRQTSKSRNDGSLTKITAAIGDAMRHQPGSGKKYSHVVMQFSLSHFDAAGKAYLLDHLKEITDLSSRLDSLEGAPYFHREFRTPPFQDRQGFILITDEFLPKNQDQKSEKDAYWKHHGAVIFDALIKGNFKLAELELEAAYSGMNRIGDFKISCEEFEDLLWRKGLRFRKFKCFPQSSDLFPSRSQDTRNPLETRALKLWEEHSGEIHALIREGRERQLPTLPREKLKALAQKFKSESLTHLRPTPTEKDVQFNDRFLASLEVKPGQEDSEANWGVYTYQITTGFWGCRPQQKILSDIMKASKTPQEAAETLFQWLKESGLYSGHDYAFLDLLQVPPHRFYDASGEEIPSYRDLQNPKIAAEWASKVDASKKVVRQCLEQYCHLLRQRYETILERDRKNLPRPLFSLVEDSKGKLALFEQALFPQESQKLHQDL